VQSVLSLGDPDDSGTIVHDLQISIMFTASQKDHCVNHDMPPTQNAPRLTRIMSSLPRRAEENHVRKKTNFGGGLFPSYTFYHKQEET
jgi:hypothetical protein